MEEGYDPRAAIENSTLVEEIGRVRDLRLGALVLAREFAGMIGEFYRGGEIIEVNEVVDPDSKNIGGARIFLLEEPSTRGEDFLQSLRREDFGPREMAHVFPNKTATGKYSLDNPTYKVKIMANERGVLDAYMALIRRYPNLENRAFKSYEFGDA